MAKFRIDGPTTGLPLQQPTSTAKSGSAQRAAQIRTKPAVTQSQASAALDAPEAPSDRTSSEGLRNQVKAGLVRLEQAYYGSTGTEPSFLKLIGTPTEQESVSDHVLSRHTKLFQKELGLTPEESRALVADLALVLA